MKLDSFSFKVFFLFIFLGQLLFAAFSSFYTTPRYEGKIYTTLGAEFFDKNDLHKLNEAAHFFGQTLIGWTKFPNFSKTLKEKAALPPDTTFKAHMQERQNMIFTFTSRNPITSPHLSASKDFLQSKLVEYNQASGTAFNLSNLDYETLELTRSYPSGAFLTFILSGGLWLCFLYVRRTF